MAWSERNDHGDDPTVEASITLDTAHPESTNCTRGLSRYRRAAAAPRRGGSGRWPAPSVCPRTAGIRLGPPDSWAKSAVTRRACLRAPSLQLFRAPSAFPQVRDGSGSPRTPLGACRGRRAPRALAFPQVGRVCRTRRPSDRPPSGRPPVHNLLNYRIIEEKLRCATPGRCRARLRIARRPAKASWLRSEPQRKGGIRSWWPSSGPTEGRSRIWTVSRAGCSSDPCSIESYGRVPSSMGLPGGGRGYARGRPQGTAKPPYTSFAQERHTWRRWREGARAPSSGAGHPQLGKLHAWGAGVAPVARCDRRAATPPHPLRHPATPSRPPCRHPAASAAPSPEASPCRRPGVRRACKRGEAPWWGLSKCGYAGILDSSAPGGTARPRRDVGS